jgi:hypothetical protein
MLGSSWVAAQLAASQEGLSSMSEWVNGMNYKSVISSLLECPTPGLKTTDTRVCCRETEWVQTYLCTFMAWRTGSTLSVPYTSLISVTSARFCSSVKSPVFSVWALLLLYLVPQCYTYIFRHTLSTEFRGRRCACSGITSLLVGEAVNPYC